MNGRLFQKQLAIAFKACNCFQGCALNFELSVLVFLFYMCNVCDAARRRTAALTASAIALKWRNFSCMHCCAHDGSFVGH